MTELIRLRRALAEAVAELAGPRSLTVVEVTAEGLTAFDMHRDETGTPRGRGRATVPWAEPAGERGRDIADVFSARRAVLDAVGMPADGTVVLMGSSPGSPRADEAMEWLRAAHPDAPAFTRADMCARALLREIVADEPLCRSYELVVLKRHPATDRLEFTCRQLFPIEARRGDPSSAFTVRCEPSGERGTAFAVVAWRDRRPALLSVQTVKVPPGRYEITAELERPGRVRFSGLPDLVRDDQDWAELVASVPARFDPPAGPAHLICAVETTGTDAQVRERLRRIGQMITTVSDGVESRLRVSLVAYGVHSYQRGVPEAPVDVAGWQISAEQARYSLEDLEERLKKRGTLSQGYAGAAMVEDMLAEVVSRLSDGGGERTVLLTVGDRPPHPPRADPSEILPCPHRIDWVQQVRRLERYPGLAFGAICDRPPERVDPVWSQLGRGGLAQLDAVDVQGLGAALGLAVPRVQRIPFPLIEVP
ncbi:hypothetical protein [Streptosporangium sp. NPDC006007]|uniref:hypothetical protein n=1 Tax=Streptosporangium sp. NPDC006007 TaxID=3154575 RepID=UPI00339F2123